MIGSSTIGEDAVVDTAALVADAQTEVSWIINNFYFDMVAFRVRERVDDRFASDAIGFFANHWMQFTNMSLNDRLESQIAMLRSFLSHALERLRQSTHLYRAQISQAI